MLILCGKTTLPIIAVYVRLILGRMPRNDELADVIAWRFNECTLLTCTTTLTTSGQFDSIASLIDSHVFSLYSQLRKILVPPYTYQVHVAFMGVYLTPVGVVPDVAYYSSSFFSSHSESITERISRERAS